MTRARQASFSEALEELKEAIDCAGIDVPQTVTHLKDKAQALITLLEKAREFDHNSTEMHNQAREVSRVCGHERSAFIQGAKWMHSQIFIPNEASE